MKDSDIQRDLRVTSFLNNTQPDFSLASRKQSASRLIDQELIREQIRLGNYAGADEQETEQFWEQIKQDRFPKGADPRRTLESYGLTENDLKEALRWQLTVLRFISVRFRPAVADVDKLEPQQAEERINKLLEDWLHQARNDAKVQYLEKALE